MEKEYEIIPSISSEQLRQSHIILWGGISGLILAKRKCVGVSEFFDIINIEKINRPRDNSYACTEAFIRWSENIDRLDDEKDRQEASSISKCYFCPLGKDFCSPDKLYNKWVMHTNHGNWEAALEYAQLIRDTQWN